MPAPLREADVVDEDVEAAEGLDGAGDDRLDAVGGREIGGDGEHAGSARSAPASVVSSAAASASAASPRAQIVTRQPSATSARALASPRPLLEPVTMATLSGQLQVHRDAQRPPRPVRSFSVQSNGE